MTRGRSYSSYETTDKPGVRARAGGPRSQAVRGGRPREQGGSGSDLSIVARLPSLPVATMEKPPQRLTLTPVKVATKLPAESALAWVIVGAPACRRRTSRTLSCAWKALPRTAGGAVPTSFRCGGERPASLPAAPAARTSIADAAAIEAVLRRMGSVWPLCHVLQTRR